MNQTSAFDRELERWLAVVAPETVRVDLDASVIARAGRLRQRPAWLVALRGGTIGSPTATRDRGTSRLRPALVVLGVVLAVLLAFVAVGALHHATVPPALRGTIVYSTRDVGNIPGDHVYVQNADGTGNRSIAEGYCPTFSRGGSALAYMSTETPMQGLPEPGHLVVANADGSNPGVVPSVNAYEYSISPDGTEIAWLKPLAFVASADGNTSLGVTSELWVTPVSGGPGTRIVAASTVPNEFYAAPAWAPDGRHIAFAVMLGVFSVVSVTNRVAIDEVSIDGSGRHHVTSRPGDNPQFSWAADGRSIAYAGVPDGATPLPSVSISPSGEVSVFNPADDLFVIGTDGTGDHNLTNTGSVGYGFAWAPDGSHLAYLTDVAGVARTAVVPANGSTILGPPIFGPASGMSPVWSSDGSALLLVRETFGPRPTKPGFVQSFETRIQAVDAEFRSQPRTVVDVANDFYACPPAWQIPKESLP